MSETPRSEVHKLLERRRFIRLAASGTAFAVLGGYYHLSDELTRVAQAQTLKNGRPRLPPGQLTQDVAPLFEPATLRGPSMQEVIETVGEVARPS